MPGRLLFSLKNNVLEEINFQTLWPNSGSKQHFFSYYLYLFVRSLIKAVCLKFRSSFYYTIKTHCIFHIKIYCDLYGNSV